ncbi:hypothetical protein LIER_06560 [Lithospermum erythrorhizon]|uniref:Uncharacterized protein n=1 Tax=Lithospermum erythrorhizon TaxID=34254 RepID=A0AAV3P594_LITER
MMGETINNPTDNSSANGNQMQTEIASLNKKRKLPAEQLGLPLSKHKNLESSYLESRSIANVHPEEHNTSLIEVESSRRSPEDVSQSESEKDSNSFSGGNATTMSLLGQLRNDIWYSKATSSDQPSTSSINLGSTCSTKSLYSLESRLVLKASSSSDVTESSYNIGVERDLDHNNFGSHSSPYFDDDHDIQFRSHADYTCSELRHDNMEQCTEDEYQDVIYSNGVIPNNYVLPSGSWSINQDKEKDAKTLTIDKEFEEYFSALML